MTKNWQESYASLRVAREPNSLVVDAFKLVPIRHRRALDIGAGALSDTRYLLQAGMTVDAVDTDPLTRRLAAELNHPHLNAIHNDVRRITLEADAYALIVAIHVLPFVPRPDLSAVISAIVDSLTGEGILCATLFGDRDGWAGKRPLTFLTKSEAVICFSGLLPISFSETEYDGFDAVGEPKHWHVFRFILQKPTRHDDR
jgi:SAM-dependent methyltransferase